MDFHAYAAQELGAVAEKLTDAARKQAEAATAQLTASFQTTMERLRADHSQILLENERLTAENATLAWQKQEQGALLDRLVEIVDDVEHASTVDGVIVAVARALLVGCARVAAIAVRETGFEIVFHHGFSDGNTSVPAFTESAAAFLGRAMQDAEVRILHDMPALAAAPFGGESSAVLTIPIGVRNEALSLIYADATKGSDAKTLEEPAKLARILRHHAALALERLVNELKAVAELRAYAKMLLDEVEYVHTADTAATISAADRVVRMKDNVRCAKQIYHQRAAVEGQTAASLLDELIAAAIRERAGTPYGQDLAAATAEPSVAVV
jgi:hypothetical protein